MKIRLFKNVIYGFHSFSLSVIQLLRYQKVNKSIYDILKFFFLHLFTKHFPMKCLYRIYIYESLYLDRAQKTSNLASELTSSSLKRKKYNILVNFDKSIEPAEKQIVVISSNFTPLIVYNSEKTLTESLCRNGHSEDVHVDENTIGSNLHI